ncbi:MAG: ShlB/FhaC/HecB family hemolysin secretion/activation protein [Campylobacter sp.]|nr:ShlB/FhaC/HecB family hemolysin secretion/activation protein [Campylobacter sp.]
MKKLNLTIPTIFIFCINLSFCADLDQTELRRQKQEKLQNLQDKFAPQQEIKQENSVENNQKLAVSISNIEISGNSLLNAKTLDEFKAKFENNIDDLQSLNDAIKALENFYLDKGFVTTRVGIDLENSDFANGKLNLVVSEGKIEKYIFDGKERNAKQYLTFPKRKDKILNLRDLDRGVENLGNEASIEILPSNLQNHSIIDINTTARKKFNANVNFNNHGTSDSGKNRIRLGASLDDGMGFGESFSGYYQERAVKHRQDKNSKNYAFNFSLPIGYYDIGYGFSKSDYRQKINAMSNSYMSSGATYNQNYYISRLFYANNKHKFSIKSNLNLKKIENYIDDTKLTMSSRRLSILSFTPSYMGQVGGGLVSAELGFHYGLRHFGANKDDEWYRDETTPKAKFDKYTIDISYYKPISNWHYKFTFSGQYSNDILYSSEKLYIGDETSVRGFRDSGLQGEKGYFVRNELGYDGFRFIKPFIAYDFGGVKDTYCTEYCNGQNLQGITLGSRFAYKNLEALFEISHALKYPSVLITNKFESYFSVSLNF